MNIEFVKRIFWKLPIKQETKEKIREKRFERILAKQEKYDQENKISITSNINVQKKYLEYCLSSYKKKSNDFVPFKKYNSVNNDVCLAAYYLTQFHPNSHNDEWWGKGTTEWNNVNQALPQFVGHYQPRKPGELGYYDLRIKDVMVRQIELAKNYGIGAFCFYYYWFDNNQRLLDEPLNMFLENKDLNISFFYCWANENWTKRFSGTNNDVLMKISQDEGQYIAFIKSVLADMIDERYYRIKGKPVLSVYCPSSIPNVKTVLFKWRSIAKEKYGFELYLIAVQERGENVDWVEKGFDAESEFQPRQIYLKCKNITNQIDLIRDDFDGIIYDYESMVREGAYRNDQNINKKIYPAVMPMWDNTARRDFRGSIFHGSTPKLYGQWLKNRIESVRRSEILDDKLVFINAWNEWGEGAYLEPDEFFGYAYLDATKNALD